MTHILIPIKDIEKRLRSLDNTRLKHKSEGNLADYDFYDGRVSELRDLLINASLGKQISLDEKDIDSVVGKVNSIIAQRIRNSYGADYYYSDMRKELTPAIKQALKDLL